MRLFQVGMVKFHSPSFMHNKGKVMQLQPFPIKWFEHFIAFKFGVHMPISNFSIRKSGAKMRDVNEPDIVCFV